MAASADSVPPEGAGPNEEEGSFLGFVESPEGAGPNEADVLRSVEHVSVVVGVVGTTGGVEGPASPPQVALRPDPPTLSVCVATSRTVAPGGACPNEVPEPTATQGSRTKSTTF